MVQSIAIYFCFFLPIFLPGISSSKNCSLKQMDADIAFILDSSSSLLDPDFQIMLKFIETFVDSVTIGPNKVRLAAALYVNYVDEKFRFDSHMNDVKLKNAIGSIKRRYGGTYTHLGLHWVLQQFTNKTFQARQSSRHIGILITDGYSFDKGSTEREAQLLHQAKVEMITIGVTNAVRQNELSAIASKNSSVFLITNFTELISIQTCFQSRFCEGLQNANSGLQPWTASTCQKKFPVNQQTQSIKQLTSKVTLTPTQKTKHPQGQSTTNTQQIKQIAKSTSVSLHNALNTLIRTSTLRMVNIKSKSTHISSTSTQQKYSRMMTTSKNIFVTTNTPSVLVINPTQPGQPSADQRVSNSPELWQIAVLAVSSLAFIGAVFCLCYFCCFNCCCKQNGHDVEELTINETESNVYQHTKQITKNVGFSRVSPTFSPVVQKAKPMPMSEGNAFIF